MRLHVGTSGYAYKEWRGSFYPPEVREKDFLRFYGGQFKTVEINNTFYRMPKREVLEKWAEDVPDGFLFVLKASRQITHLRRLKDVSDPLMYLLGQARALGEKLGPILVQTPPNLRLDLARLEAFLSLVPSDVRLALEFRDPSWRTDAVYRALEGRGAALVCADQEAALDGKANVDLRATADFGYLRLRACNYDDAALEGWARRIAQHGWKEVFVFFKHEEEGTGPELARRFMVVQERTR